MADTGERLTCTFNLYFRQGGSDKYYNAELDGTTITSKYGRSYARGQITEKHFDTPEQAAKEFYRLGRDKMRKGYRIRTVEVSDTAHANLTKYRWSDEYGGVERERVEVTLDLGAQMIANLTLPQPDETLLFDSMFASGDADLVGALARSHPSVKDSDLASAGAWFSGLAE